MGHLEYRELPSHFCHPIIYGVFLQNFNNYHPAVSSSVVPFSSCPQSLPASESFCLNTSMMLPTEDKQGQSKADQTQKE